MMLFVAPGDTLGEGRAAPEETALSGNGTEAEEEEPTLEVGGALRFNYVYRDWVAASGRKGGNLFFDTFRVNADGGYRGLAFSAEYRFYAGYHFIHHGYVGYAFSDVLAAQVGVHRVPFGLLPYASNNWFFNLSYYVGLEDDYDAGLKVLYRQGPLDVQAAFYKNSEGSFTGGSLGSARYSYDIVPLAEGTFEGVAARANEEVNQFNLRLAYHVDHGGLGETALGLSGQLGGLYNNTTDRTGRRWAAAGHLDGSYGRFNLKLEALRYVFEPENPEGQDERFVIMGAYDAPYRVASRAYMLLGGLSYTLPVAWGPISSLTFYDDYTYMDKDVDGFEDSQQNVLGALVTAGPLYVYIDLATAINQPFLGPYYARVLAQGAPAPETWHTRFNVNIGYYF